MADKTVDVAVVGAGHNGLVAGATLAKSGLEVVVCEQRSQPGGLASRIELAPGYHAPLGPDLAGLLLDEVVQNLNLSDHGLELVPLDPIAFAIGPNGTRLLWWRDDAKTIEEIRKLSARDAEAYPTFASLIRQLAGFLRPLLSKPAPLPEIESTGDVLELLKVGWGLKRLGARSMHELLRVLPLAISDFLDEHFESDLVKATLAAPGLDGLCLGPRSAGTAAMFLYHQLGDPSGPLHSRKAAKGDVGRALAASFTANGGKLRTDARVEAIVIEHGRVKGVRLEGGETIHANTVLSNLSPRATFRELSEPDAFEPSFLEEVDAIRYRGIQAKLLLALSELPAFGGNAELGPEHRSVVQVGASLDALERAYDEVKYGTFSREPFLRAVLPSLFDPSMAPEGKHVLSITMQYAPYRLRAGSWKEHRQALETTILDAMETVAPNLRSAIVHKRLLTPEDYQAELGVTEGSFHQGEMALDQMFFMRPVPGFARYQTPVEGLYLCGAATHPGGEITGACGLNAARRVLQSR